MELLLRPAAMSRLRFGVAEVVRLQKNPNSHEFGYRTIKTCEAH
jgi:hypothetical protein